jgi:NADPH-dependent curcumin reductase CurA
MAVNRQWLLARAPGDRVSLKDFAYREVPFDPPVLAEGQVALHTRLFRFVPAARTWMKRTSAFVPAMPVGQPVMGSAAAEVIASRHPAYPVGTVVSAMTGWQDYAVVAPDALPVPLRVKAETMDLVDFEGLFGGNSLTAYFGLLKVGEPRSGETLLVSGAAGSTGSMAAQIGRICGLRVIGIAGGADKCRWLVDTLGLDAAIDYRGEDVEARLGALCPDGVNIFYDNVGGAMLDAAIAHMAPHGRIILCGQISSYDDGDALSPGPKDMMRVIYWRLKLQGFLSFDYDEDRPAAESDLARWAAEGRLVHHAEMVDGFDRLPSTYLRLFDGSHRGTLLLRP